MNSFFQCKYSVLLVWAIFLVAATGCRKGNNVSPEQTNLVKNEGADVPLAWMGLYLKLDRYTRNFRPGPTSRALAYINLAAYESVMKGMPAFKSLQSLYPGLELPTAGEEEYHYPTVVNAVYSNLFKRLVPGEYIQASHQSELQFDILILEEGFDETFKSTVGSAQFARSKEYGEAVADAVWDWSKTDPFGHEAYLIARPDGYTPPNGPGLWQPTPPGFEAALFPYWGNARTLALAEQDKLSQEPLTFSEQPSSQFYVQALEVTNTVNNLEFNDQWMVEFWNGNEPALTFSPAARWLSVANQVIEKEGATLETALYTYAKLSIALNDAGIACRHSKYTYNVERPVSYIQRVFDADWQPYLSNTPSCPSYPSGHAAYGAAAAEVLSHIFGYNYAMTDNSYEGRTDLLGMPRSFDTFYQMAEENAQSRLYGGMCFRMDIEEGLRLGYKVGRKVNAMPFR